MLTDPRRLRELTSGEALRRLADVPVGRIVFTTNALPAIRPVNHVLIDGDVILRCHEGAALLSAVGQIVAYEADVIDAQARIAWSVIATGRAIEIDNPDETARIAEVLQPWVGREMTHIIRIHPEIVSGFELVEGQIDRADG